MCRNADSVWNGQLKLSTPYLRQRSGQTPEALTKGASTVTNYPDIEPLCLADLACAIAALDKRMCAENTIQTASERAPTLSLTLVN